MAIDKNFQAKLNDIKVNAVPKNETIRNLISDFASGKIMIPEYQRTFVWDISKQCRFIESIFIEIPIPPIFLMKKYNDKIEANQFEIIDGVQRITSLNNFFNGSIRLSNLKKLPELNQMNFKSLPPYISEIFLERTLNVVTIKKDTHPEIQFEVFGRLNQGSVSLNAQELRNCMYYGAFNDFLKKCATKKYYKKLLEPFPKFKSPTKGKPDLDRMLSTELILRFFTLYEKYDKNRNQYPDARTETLNSYMRERRDLDTNPEQTLSERNQFKTIDFLENLLEKVSTMVFSVFKNKHFRNCTITKDNHVKFSNSLNQSIFDIQMLGFADFEHEDIKGLEEVIYEEFLNLSLYDRDFSDSVSKSTSYKVAQRVETWKSVLIKITEDRKGYLSEMELKKRKFAASSICHSSKQEIDDIDNAVLYDDFLYHRAFCPQLIENNSRSKLTVNSSVKVKMSNREYEFESIYEAYNRILIIIKSKLSEMPQDERNYHIDRLEKFDFIGNHDKVENYITSQGKTTIKTKELRIDHQHGESIVIDISGGRGEMIKNIKAVASLFSFMSDFEIK